MTISVTKATITLAAADTAIEAALAKASETGVLAAVAITDEAGNLKAFKRVEGCSLLSGKAAIGKAFTAATSGFDTAGFFEFIKGDLPLLHGIPNLDGMVVFGGGKQIMDASGQVVGAIGVAGGHYSQDEVIADAALAALQEAVA